MGRQQAGSLKFLTTGLLVVSLAGTVFLTSSHAWADGRGIIIDQDSDSNIHVTLDPSLIPDAQVRRKEDQVIIELPDSAFPGGFERDRLDIAPRLTQQSDVEVSRGSHGTQVKINSGHVFLSIQDLSKLKSAPGDKPATSEKPSTPDLSPVELIQKKPANTSKTAQAERPMVNAAFSKPATLASAASGSKPETTTAEASKKTETPKATEKSTATKAELAHKPAPPVQPLNTLTLSDEAARGPFATPEAAKDLVDQPVSGTELIPLPEPGEEDFLSDSESVHNFETTPLEKVTLDRNRALFGDGSLFRLLGSLLVVLMLAGAFLKYGLPRLMERFPQFFPSRTGRSGRKSADALFASNDHIGLAGLSDTNLSDIDLPAYNDKVRDFLTRWQPEENAADEPGASQALAVGKENRLANTLPEDEQEGFNVLVSSPIGKDRELHLVEIRGRQIILATAGEQVSFLTELGNDGAFSRKADPLRDELLTQIQPLQPAVKAYIEERPSNYPGAQTSQNSDLYKKYLPPTGDAQPTTRTGRPAYIPSYSTGQAEARGQSQTIATEGFTARTPQSASQGQQIQATSASHSGASRSGPVSRPKSTQVDLQAGIQLTSNPPQASHQPASQAKSRLTGRIAANQKSYSEQILEKMNTPSTRAYPPGMSAGNNPRTIEATDVVVLNDYDDEY